ncbi:MAG TPA: SRPBCC family protein [Nocardioidaceae bacterium]|nr:SRPBCC family protein [Nocardioidaceae bacterium]
MQLEHRFTVPAPIDVAWEALNDVEGVGSCFPGAAVTSVEGDEFSGTCKVKLGPISMQYSGSGKFVERDQDSHRAVIEAKGKDRRGNGTASVTVTTVLSADAEDRTTVSVDTDLNITGKPAQFGRGVIQDVSDKLLGQFTACLESKIGAYEDRTVAAESTPAAVPESGSSVAQPSADEGVPPQLAAETSLGAAETEGAEPPGPVPAPPSSTASQGRGAAQSSARPSSTAESALDLGATVLPVLAKRYAPYALGALAVLVLLWRFLRR